MVEALQTPFQKHINKIDGGSGSLLCPYNEFFADISSPARYKPLRAINACEVLQCSISIHWRDCADS